VRLLPGLLVASVLAVLPAAGANDFAAVPPTWHTFRGDGITLRYPPRWFATARPLTPVSSPAQLLAVASYPLPHDHRGADGCRPTEAIDGLPRRGAFVYGWDYGSAPHRSGFRARDFPRRPQHFRLGGFGRYECLGPSYLVRFQQAGRFVQIHVVLGARATAATRAKALRIVGSIRLR
jgi:hypothetical protein